MKKEPKEPCRVFRPRPRSILVYSVIPALSLFGSVAYGVADPFDWVSLGFYGFTLLALGGFVELVKTRLILYPDCIHVWHNFKRSIIKKDEFEKVTWEKGCDASIMLKDGTWISIPTPGTTAQGICNTIRAWKKRS